MCSECHGGCPNCMSRDELHDAYSPGSCEACGERFTSDDDVSLVNGDKVLHTEICAVKYAEGMEIGS